MRRHSIEHTITDWLQRNPSGQLYVAVGYASSWGIRWLSEHTKNRPVILIIGDIRRNWQRDSEVDRRVAIQFLERSDVSVKTWYRTNRSKQGESAAHLKAWMVKRSDGGANILFGSANLSRAGLRNNIEMMAEPSELYRDVLQSQMEYLLSVSWPSSDKLLDRLAPPSRSSQRDQSSAPRPSQSHDQPAPQSKSASRQPVGAASSHRASTGCLTRAAAFAAVIVIVLVVASMMWF